MAKAHGLAALVVSSISGTMACPFGGGRGQPLPAGHPDVDGRRLRRHTGLHESEHWKIRDATATDEGGWSNLWNYGGKIIGEPTGNDNFKSVVDLSQQHNDTELCYFSFQTLPGPEMVTVGADEVSVTDDDLNAWGEMGSESSEAPNWMDHAIRRMQAMARALGPDGPIMWAHGSTGRWLRAKYCSSNFSSKQRLGDESDCNSSAVINQTLKLPTAIVIFKVQASRQAEVWDMMYQWRTNATHGHVHEMGNPMVHDRGWGKGGQIITKTVLCSDIPSMFRYTNFVDGDLMGPNGILWADEAFNAWSAMCNLRHSSCPWPTPKTTTTGTTTGATTTGMTATNGINGNGGTTATTNTTTTAATMATTAKTTAAATTANATTAATTAAATTAGTASTTNTTTTAATTATTAKTTAAAPTANATLAATTGATMAATTTTDSQANSSTPAPADDVAVAADIATTTHGFLSVLGAVALLATRA